MSCWNNIDYDKLLNPPKKRKVRGCHSNGYAWKHFYENNKQNDIRDRQAQARIKIRHKELVDEGIKSGDAVFLAVKEVKWDASN